MVVNVDFPTPPFPDRTRILCFIPDRREVMKGMSGSGPLGVVAQMDWFGQPVQASPFPARLDSGPGQCSGSGTTSFGVFFGGAERSTCIGSSSEGAMAGFKREERAETLRKSGREVRRGERSTLVLSRI